MSQAFHERTDAVEKDHEEVGTGEPVHVEEEVAGELSVIQRIADEGREDHQEEHRDGEEEQPFGREAKAEANPQSSHSQEGEVLDFALEGHFQDHRPERVRPQKEAHPVVEQEVEDAVAEEHEEQQSREAEHEEVHCAVQKHIVVPCFFHVPLVRVGVVEPNFFDGAFQVFFGIAQAHQLPLLFLEKLDDVEDLS